MSPPQQQKQQQHQNEKLKRADLLRLAKEKLRDAKALLAHGRYEGAIYNSGYVVEFALKVRICLTLQWSEYLTKENYKSFKTHNLDVLLSLGGRAAYIRRYYRSAWDSVGRWNPEDRYLRQSKVSKQAAQLMISSSEKLLRALTK